jgi:hypothetical protein
MFEEHNLVRLREAMPAANLPRGAVGTIVQVFEQPAAFLVEFTDAQGQTLAMEAVKAESLDLLWTAQQGWVHVNAHAA